MPATAASTRHMLAPWWNPNYVPRTPIGGTYRKRNKTGRAGTKYLGPRRARQRGTSLVEEAQATGAERGAFHQYLLEIDRTVSLTDAAESQLLERLHEGEGNVVNPLIEHALWIVPSLALQHEGQGVSLMELVGVGNEELCLSVPKYRKGHSQVFLVWLSTRVRVAMCRAIGHDGSTSLVGSERHASVIAAHVSAMREGCTRSSVDALASASGMSTAIVRESLAAERSVISWDVLRTFEARGHPVLAPEKDEACDVGRIAEALDSLPPRDARVLRMLFGFDGEDPLSSSQVGSRLGISVSRVDELVERALGRLRSMELR